MSYMIEECSCAKQGRYFVFETDWIVESRIVVDGRLIRLEPSRGSSGESW